MPHSTSEDKNGNSYSRPSHSGPRSMPLKRALESRAIPVTAIPAANCRRARCCQWPDGRKQWLKFTSKMSW